VKSIRGLLLIIVFGGICTSQAQTPFSTDSAAAYLRTIAVDIGGRPMGSPNERRVAEFALRKFREFGMVETYLMPIKEYPGYLGGTPTNTQSNVAVGVLRGKSERIIVLGAHMDSADPDIPGANDDGSGCAVVIELARALSTRANESTIVFALFGGEESGLQGSRFFVENYPDLDRVALMLQVDMANGAPLLFPTLDFDKGSAPEWLVRASYEEFSKLGYTGLHFPTDFFVFMGAMPSGGVGSDHEPFLQKGIPAIDFTSDARDPIHTPQDNFENFKVSGLKRSGDLVYKLVERFDAGVPEQKTGNYFLYEVATFPVFVPLWVLRVFTVVALVVGVLALVTIRKRRIFYEGVPKPRIPGLKLFLLMLIIQTCVWLSENIVAAIKGVRYPWMSDINGYYVLAFFGACIGIWVSLHLSKRLGLRHDGYPYFLRAVIFLVVFIGISALLSAKLAFYPAVALFLLSLAMLVRQPILKALFWLLSPHFMFRLFFTEVVEFIGRFAHSQPEITPLINAIMVIGYVLFFSVWAFPFLLGFAAVYFDAKTDLLWLSRWKGRSIGFAVAVMFLLTVGVLASRESYSKEWRPSIWVGQQYDVDSTRGTLVVRSPEYLSGTRLSFAGKDTLLVGSDTKAEFVQALPAPSSPWISVERVISTSRKDTALQVDLHLYLKLQHRPYKLKVAYSSQKGKIFDASSPYALGSTDRSATLQWAAFPDSSLTIPISFSLTAADSSSLQEHIEAVFLEEPQPVSVHTRMGLHVVRRTTVGHQSPVVLR